MKKIQFSPKEFSYITKIILSVLTPCLIYVGCVKIADEKIQITLDVSKTSLDFIYSGAEESFSVSSNYQWTVNNNASWLIVSPLSGSNNDTVKVIANPNTNTDSRTATITVSNNVQGVTGITRTISVTQEAPYLTVSPPEIILTGVPHIPANQTVSVTSNAEWTLTSNQPWLLLSLSENGSDASATVGSFGDRTIYVVAEGNGGDDERTASIYLVTVIQESLITEPGQAAPRIYIDKTEGDEKLMLTKSPTNYGAFFQYGSVIGWNWNSITADYNPTNDLSLNNWNINWNNGNKNVEHTYAELMQGRGDPCRLVGYSQTEIKAALVAGRLLDNTLWKLPSNTENIVFGSPSSIWTSINGTPGRVIAEAGNPVGVFLPAAGRKIAESGIYGQRGSMGFYITSSIENASNAPFMLYFNEQTLLESYNQDGQQQGFSVRCIRQ